MQSSPCTWQRSGGSRLARKHPNIRFDRADMDIDYLSKYLNKDKKSTRKRKNDQSRIIDDMDVANQAAESQAVQLRAKHDSHTSSLKESKFVSAFKDVSQPVKKRATSPSSTRLDVDNEPSTRAEKPISSEQTVYRDATGRRIDISMARQAKARELQREQDLKRQQKVLSAGVVQQAEKAAALESFKLVEAEPFARHADHSELEAELKSRKHWDDPMSGVILDSTTKTAMAAGARPAVLPEYTGRFAVNRFGIRPGYRWDGVDRGNGFEARRFKELADLATRRQDWAQWSKEDM